MTLYKSTGPDSRWIALATALLLLFILAGTGCQTFSGFSKQEDGDTMSLNSSPSQKHKPKSLDSLVRPQVELPSLPPSVANHSTSVSQGINIDDVGLDPESIHVEGEMSIEDITASSQRQLPEILESTSGSIGDVQQPDATSDPVDGPNSSGGETGNPLESVTTAPGTQSAPEVVAPVSIAPQHMSSVPAQPNQSTASPPSSESNANQPVSDVPVLTLNAKSASDVETKLSEEIDSLLGPVSGQTPPAEFDPNSFSIGDQSVMARPKPLVASPNPNDETAGDSSTQEASRIHGVEHAIWAGGDANTAAPISIADESDSSIESLPEIEPTTNEKNDSSASSPRQLTWQEQLQISIELLNSQLEKQENSDNAPLDAVRLRLMQIVAGTNTGEPFEVTGLPEHQAAFWRNQFDSIQVMLNGSPDEDITANQAALQRRRATTAARHLELAANQLASEASLQISNATFCSQVRGFGQFTASSNVFVPSQQVLIYCEIANYALRPLPSDATGGDSQMADLRGQFVIVDDKDQVVHQHQYQSVQDKTRWRRKDFYMYFPVTIPQLTPGRYRLQLSIEDMVGQKFASAHPDLVFTISPGVPHGSNSQQKTANSAADGVTVK